MKICVISPGVVHAIPRTLAIADYFDEIQFIDMAGSADRKLLESHRIDYRSLSECGNSQIGSLNLQKLLRQLHPDVIVCHFASGDHFFNAIAYARCPVAVVAMGHDVFYDRGDAAVPLVVRLLTRMGLRHTAYISAKSHYLAERIRSYGVKSPMDINYWGADLSDSIPAINGPPGQNLDFQ